MVAVYTIKRSQYDLSPAFLLMAAAAVSFVVVIEQMPWSAGKASPFGWLVDGFLTADFIAF